MQVQNLTHPTIQAKIEAALREAVKSSLSNGGGQAYVYNRFNQPVFRVKHTRGTGGGFTFYRGNKNIKQNVLLSLRKRDKINFSF